MNLPSPYGRPEPGGPLGRAKPGAPRPRQGTGTLQWNAGGYFGSVLGLTLWMLLTGLLLIPVDRPRGMAVVGLTLLAIAVAVGLWRARARLAPHPAFQILLLVCLAAAAGTLTLIAASNLGPEVANQLGNGRPLWTYPLLMLGLWLLDRRGRQQTDA